MGRQKQWSYFKTYLLLLRRTQNWPRWMFMHFTNIGKRQKLWRKIEKGIFEERKSLFVCLQKTDSHFIPEGRNSKALIAAYNWDNWKITLKAVRNWEREKKLGCGVDACLEAGFSDDDSDDRVQMLMTAMTRCWWWWRRWRQCAHRWCYHRECAK